MVAVISGRHDISSALATVFHSINSYVVLGQYCRGSTVAVRAVVILSGTSRSSNKGQRQAVIVAKANGVHTLSCGCQLQVPM